MGAGGQDRRYQVFISSTFKDLQEERQEIIQALLELDCFPAGMELFPASDDEKWELIQSVIDDSDFYLVIVGGRYGSVDAEGISYTEREYDYAVASGKPVLGFLHADPEELPVKNSEKSTEGQAKLAAFRAKVEERMCKRWTTASELGSVVSRSLVKEMKGSAAVGWVRGDSALTTEYVEEMSDLRRQIAEFELERERSRTSAPHGTEAFAQGADRSPLAYTWDGVVRVNTFENDLTHYNGAVSLSWDEIMRAVGPMMFDEASEKDLKVRVDALAREFFIEFGDDDEEEDLEYPPGTAISKFSVDQAAFDTVKVQLVALRLIEKSDKKHGIHDRNTYWRLTPYGETYTMTLLAIRRPPETSA